MDLSHGYGQSLSPSVAKHAENYHKVLKSFVCFGLTSSPLKKKKEKRRGKCTSKELTNSEINQRWIFL